MAACLTAFDVMARVRACEAAGGGGAERRRGAGVAMGVDATVAATPSRPWQSGT